MTPMTELPQYLGGNCSRVSFILDGVLDCYSSAVWDEELYSVPSGG